MKLSTRLWRWNAYVIFLAGILAIALLIVSIVMIVADEIDDSANAVSVAPERVAASSQYVGVFEIVPGPNVLRAPLYVDQKLASSLPKENTSVQNYLFYDPAAGSSYWLLDGPPTLLASAKALPTDDYGQRTEPVVAFVYEQVSRDTDGDERLTGDDLKTIALSDAAGKRFTPLLNDVTNLHAAELMKDDTIVLVYTAASKMRAVNVDLASFRVVRETPVEAR